VVVEESEVDILGISEVKAWVASAEEALVGAVVEAETLPKDTREFSPGSRVWWNSPTCQRI